MKIKAAIYQQLLILLWDLQWKWEECYEKLSEVSPMIYVVRQKIGRKYEKAAGIERYEYGCLRCGNFDEVMAAPCKICGYE